MMTQDFAPTAELMRNIMRALDESLNPGLKGAEKTVGLIVLTFPYGTHDGKANYISNGADRRDIVAFLKETAARLEGQPLTPGRA